MIEKLIFRDVVYKLLQDYPFSSYAVIDNTYITFYLGEAGRKVVEGSFAEEPLGNWTNCVFPAAECAIFWDYLHTLPEWLADDEEFWLLLRKYRYLVINCEGPGIYDTEHLVRLLSKYGYTEHYQLDQKRKQLGWGCRVLELVGERKRDFVSVVVPTKDTAQFVETALQSILSQTIENLEVIVIDDGSTDDSADRAWRVLSADYRRHEVFRCTHRGAAAARQFGIDRSIGDFIVCFDSDDYMPPNYLQTALTSFTLEVDFVYPRQWWLIPEEVWDEHLTFLLREGPSHELRTSSWDPAYRAPVAKVGCASLHMNSANWREASQLGSTMIISTVCRASFSQQFDSANPRLQDWDMHLNLANRGARGVGFFSAPLIRLRSTGSITTTNTREEYNLVRSRIMLKRGISTPPKIFFTLLNSNHGLDLSLASHRMRGTAISSLILHSQVGDLEQLKAVWREFDVIYFIAMPTPTVAGWCRFLKEQGKRVIFDVCVAHWSPDHTSGGLTGEEKSHLLTDIASSVHFIAASPEIGAHLAATYGENSVTLIEDCVTPFLNYQLKSDYSSTGRVVWFGIFGNIPSLLNFQSELCTLDCIVRLVSDPFDLRLPFRWEWRPWSIETQERDIIECDVALVPKVLDGSYKYKARAKLALASMLGMPVVIPQRGTNWLRQLVELLNSEEARVNNGRENLKRAVREYPTVLHARELLRVINALTEVSRIISEGSES